MGSQAEMSQDEINDLLDDLESMPEDDLDTKFSEDAELGIRVQQAQELYNSCNNIAVLVDEPVYQFKRKILNSKYDVIIINNKSIKVPSGTGKFYRFFHTNKLLDQYLVTVMPCGSATYAKYKHPKYLNISIDCRVEEATVKF